MRRTDIADKTATCLVALLLFLMLVPGRVYAEIDPASGEFATVSVDLSKSLGGMVLEFRRFYRSGWQHKGLFGRSWCSFLDDRLLINSNEIKFIYCGRGRETVLKEISPGSFRSEGGARLIINRSGSTFTLKDGTTTSKVFNREGFLTRILGHQGDWIEIERSSGGRPFRLSTSRGDRFLLGVDSSGLLTRVTWATKTLKFSFRRDLLIGVTSRNEKAVYEYDNRQRLIGINEDGVKQDLTYDEQGRVIRVARSGCQEQLSYTQSGNLLRTQVRLSCGPRTIATREYSTQFDSKKEKIVSQSQTGSEGTRKIILHPRFGLPQRVVRSHGESVYSYDDGGNLLSESKGKVARVYEYDKNGFLSKYSLTDGPRKHEVHYQFGKDGQIEMVRVGRDIWKFLYESSGNIKEFRSPASTSIEYLGKGRSKLIVFKDDERKTAVVNESSLTGKGSLQEAARTQLEILHYMDPLRRLADFYSGVYE